MANTREPTEEEAITLFEAIEKTFPHGTLGDDKWYLVTVSQLQVLGTQVANNCQLSALLGTEPTHAGYLYTYLTKKPEYTTPESRQALVRRLREALVKNTSIQGVVRALEALFSITKLERPEDRDYSFSR